MKEQLLYGTRNAKPYQEVNLEQIIDKTVGGVVKTATESDHGLEMVIAVLFKDQTKASFILPIEVDEDLNVIDN